MREFEVGMMAKSLSGHDKDSLYIIMDIKDYEINCYRDYKLNRLNRRINNEKESN